MSAIELAANLLGKPGKMGVQGHMVQDMYDAGQLAEINDYCRCDVLDTYFLFLRTRVLLGELAIEREQEIVRDAKEYISMNRDRISAFKIYLDNWGDWNPWP